MELDYTFFYVEANVVCIILFAIMLFREIGTVGRQTKQIFFINNVICYMLYFTSDIFWVMMLHNVLPRTQFWSSIVNFANAVFLTAIAVFWFIYIEISQNAKYIKNVKKRIIISIPVALNIITMAVLFLFFPSAVLKEDFTLTDTYYYLFIAIPTLYIIASSIRSFSRAFKRENYAVRRQYLVCAAYPLVLVFFGVVQTLFFNGVLFCFGVTINMIYIYIISLDDQVSMDELTHLNNRTQLKKYLATEHGRPGGDRDEHYVLMIDLNKFKQINDQFGHVEGDMALRRTADALKMACSFLSVRSFIARYGGDEFIMIIKTDDEEAIKALCANIKNTLVRLNKEANPGYDLTASIGYASYSGDLKSFQGALAKADEALYEDKKATH
ncbi:MAG: GGDEF domain-containing protein [Saccharofermentans sp.]|nr:GGDEF domain-containing protein [Saccharofermentans sp.]